MNTSLTAVVLLCLGVCLGGLLLPGCEKPLTPEAVACKARIATFRSVVGLDDVQMLRDGRNIVEQALSLTNNQERIAVLREFVDEFYKIDISKCTVKEARSMIGRYCLMPEYLAYGLIRAGGSKEEAWQALVKGLEKYRVMCFSYGDENDMADGWSREDGDRRHVARWGRKSWMGFLQFCRDHTIKSVFGGDKETIEQFRVRLQKKFNMEK